MALDRGDIPRKLPEITPADLKEVVEDIGGPGIYPSGDLYKWYAGMCREKRQEPVSKHLFGVTLKRLGYNSVIRRVCEKNTRCWIITRRVLDPEGAGSRHPLQAPTPEDLISGTG